jgi:hypothetical protein
MDMEDVGMIVLILAGAIVVFLLLREFFCWYWKINEIRDLLKSLNEKLENKSGKAESQNIDKAQKVSASHPLSNNQVKFFRLRNNFGSTMLLDIKVDDKKFQLENGEEKTIDMQNGTHTCSVSFNDDYDKFDFEVENNSTAINILTGPPLKVEIV